MSHFEKSFACFQLNLQGKKWNAKSNGPSKESTPKEDINNGPMKRAPESIEVLFKQISHPLAPQFFLQWERLPSETSRQVPV